MPRPLGLCCTALALLPCVACGSDDDDAAGSDAAPVDASSAPDASCPEPSNCWQTEGFGPDEVTTGEGPIAAALDAAGGLHVAYVASTRSEGTIARYARRETCTSWTHETLGRTPSSGIAIVAEPSGTVHVAYVSLDERLVVATLSEAGGSWSQEEVADCDEMSDVAMAVDAEGVLHVAYMTPSSISEDPKLGYATNASGAWTVELPDVQRAFDVRMAVGPDSNVYVTFGGSFSNWHAERTEAGWTATDVTEAGIPREALAIDAGGTVHAFGFTPLVHWSRPPGGEWAELTTIHDAGHDPVVTWAGDVGYAWFEGAAHELEGDDLYFARYRDGAWDVVDAGRQFMPAQRALAADETGRAWVVAAFYAALWTCP